MKKMSFFAFLIVFMLVSLCVACTAQKADKVDSAAKKSEVALKKVETPKSEQAFADALKTDSETKDIIITLNADKKILLPKEFKKSPNKPVPTYDISVDDNESFARVNFTETNSPYKAKDLNSKNVNSFADMTVTGMKIAGSKILSKKISSTKTGHPVITIVSEINTFGITGNMTSYFVFLNDKYYQIMFITEPRFLKEYTPFNSMIEKQIMDF